MITRRHLLIALGVAACGPRLVLAQSKPPIVIGWLNTGSRSDDEWALTAFKQGMAALGWKEGSGYTLEEVWAEGVLERLPALAEKLKAGKPAIIVAALSRATQAAARASPTIPVVQANGGPPTAVGLARSLSRPGGMVTGLTNIASEISAKYFELLLAAVPALKRIGLLVDSTSVYRSGHLEAMRNLAKRHSVEVRFAEAAKLEELEPALSRLAQDGVQGLVLLPSSVWGVERERARIMKLALAQRWPVVAGSSQYLQHGALLSYGVDGFALYRRAAYYVDRILKGAKPGDLPIEQPTQFELIVNLRAAKTLGLTLPQELLLRADKVIE